MTTLPRKLKRVLCLALFCWIVDCATAATRMRSWSHFTHRQTGVVHTTFWAEHYRRGIYLGPCGFATTSIQWEYHVDLTGPGPVYSTGQIMLKDEGDFRLPEFAPVAGTVVVDEKAGKVRVDLKIKQGDTVRDFTGNGSYRINEKF